MGGGEGPGDCEGSGRVRKGGGGEVEEKGEGMRNGAEREEGERRR